MNSRARAILVGSHFCETFLHIHSQITSRSQSGWRSTPSWYSDKWQSNERQTREEPAGYKDCGGREDQVSDQLTGAASASTDGGRRQESGRKSSTVSKPRGSSNTPVKACGNSRKSLMQKKGSLKKLTGVRRKRSTKFGTSTLRGRGPLRRWRCSSRV